MSRNPRVLMLGVAVATALLSTVGAASVADHQTHDPAGNPATKIDNSLVDDKDDDRDDLGPSTDAPRPRAWLSGSCAAG